MDHVPGDARDPTGQCRVPTSEQSVFIFTHYPTCAQPSTMITKIYELYNAAAYDEQMKDQAEASYSKPRGNNRPQNQEDEDEDVNLLLAQEEESFGGPVRKQNKKTQAAAVKKANEE